MTTNQNLRNDVLRWGRASTSYQLLEPGLRYWHEWGKPGWVAYLAIGPRKWVAAGHPICPPTREREILDAMTCFAMRHRIDLSFFGVEDLSVLPASYRAQKIGQQPFLEASAYDSIFSRSTVREQLRRARAKGVVVRAANPQDEEAISALHRQWFRTRKMESLQFMAKVHLENPWNDKKAWVATFQEQILGAVFCVPFNQGTGWFFEDCLRAQGAPNGMMETLIATASRELMAVGAQRFTLGLVPLDGLDGRVWSLIRKLGNPFYGFEELAAFRRKFRPARWENVYLAYPKGKSLIMALEGTLKAFSGGRNTRFLAKTLENKIRR